MSYKDKNKQKKYHKKYHKLWYQKNKKKVKLKAHKFKNFARKRNKKFINEYLRSHPCIDCKEKNIIVLEFDHVKGIKYKEISILIYRAVSIKTLEKEIEKCEVRCSNCHKIRHHNLRASRGSSIGRAGAL